MWSRRAPQHQIYPVVEKSSFLSTLPTRYRVAPPARCPVCDRFTLIAPFKKNVRESGICVRCGSTNRNRQLARILRLCLQDRFGLSGGTLASLVDRSGARVFNTEAQGPVHHALAPATTYTCSEYFGDDRTSGDLVDGVQHQDLRALSFPDEDFDLVLSSDVLEHVPTPYQAHREIFRVLRPEGRHIFTVPFLADRHMDLPMARLEDDGEVTYLKEPEYHGDPLRPEGALVFTIFSLEMLIRLAEIGFHTRLHSLSRARNGIYPPGSLVFEAIKMRPAA